MVALEFIVVACDEPDRVASFWEAAIDGERRELPPSFDPIVDTPGGGPDMLFRDLPKGTQRDMPIHLDLSTDDREATVEQLRELGAGIRETKRERYETLTAEWTVMEDPEGNGFCVCELCEE